ncbi:nucleoside recognition domain-containing protein [Pusillimonas sp. ANT_WB101]|uniref:nucleoside recognition domain-containing protein n=1 Tax=Pusillimonas sp. ANT_WB101 TaxID=2597356 RepID=UPI00210541C5|nr:nucleoside recognition domain-containing protein [Pusillimonas sp. ANT_WB101]
MLTYALTLLRRSWRMFITIARIMLPVMVIVKVAQEFGLVDLVGRLITPAMGLLNLPPEAGLIWATTVLIGMFGGIATLSTLATSIDMTVGQMSALGAMMLFAHSLPVEQAIVRRAGASFWLTAALRLGTAIVYGAAVGWACHFTGALSEPVSFAWLSGSSFTQGASGYLGWMQATAYSLGIALLIIIVLVAVLDAFERVGITRRITSTITPLLRISGLSAEVAPVTTVGVLLGLSYGGALIIDESEKKNFSRRTRFLALSWLCLSHSLIEDTLLIMALGANLWVVLVGRVAITLAIISLLAWLTDRGNWRTAGIQTQQS